MVYTMLSIIDRDLLTPPVSIIASKSTFSTRDKLLDEKNSDIFYSTVITPQSDFWYFSKTKSSNEKQCFSFFRIGVFPVILFVDNSELC